MSGAGKIKAESRIRVFLLLVTTVMITAGSVWVWLYVNRSVEEQRRVEFTKTVEDTQDEVITTTLGVVERLYDIRGFLSGGEVTGTSWKNFLMSTGIEERNPGVYTFAYAPLIKKADLPIYIEDVRSIEKGVLYENYSVFPVTENGDLFPLRYLSTTDKDIASLLGYDLGTSENQVAAIKETVTNDIPVITNLLHLSLVLPGNTKTGYVIMLPVYSRADINEFAKEDRRKYLKGLIGTWIFPEGLISNEEKNQLLQRGNIKLTIFDGENKLFSVGDGNQEISEIKDTREVTILNRKFTFEFVATKKKMLGSFTESLSLLSALGLFLVDAMWVTTVTFILMSRRRAVKLADEATKDLRKFKQAVAGVSDHVVITDTNGVIIYANRAAEKITGYKLSALLGQTPALWGKQMDNGFYKKFWETIKVEKKPFWGEVVNKRKSGELYEAEVNVSPILDENGKLLFFVGIERDLTRVKAMEKMKTEFISLASHQLRTPLSAVKWFGKMLLTGDAGKLSQKQKEYVRLINESNEKEINLVNSLLNVSRIESGKIVITPKPTNLIDLVEAVIIDNRTEAEKGRKKIKTLIDKRIPEVMIDGDLVRHVYANFISNAIRYTKMGGTILIKVYLDKNRIMSEVKDNGIGVPKEEQKRVFEKFFRASNALKKETDGNGLGLYLSKTIVESSGGKIGFRSSEEKGSTFWFTLPINLKSKKS